MRDKDRHEGRPESARDGRAAGRPVRLLDGALVDQIAAGEVVERPASVVKELLENAVDASARSVTVDIAEGGTGLIRVSDDGHGMSREDAVLAVKRHATSKIHALDDLHALGTLGFRGEALPSIASVSRFSLITRLGGDLAATRIHIEGAGPAKVTETGAASGTTVEVRDLFYNVPARRKFLKSSATESAHVGDVCQRTALAEPHLRLVLSRDGRRAREYLPTDDVLTRAEQVLSETRLRRLEGERDGIGVQAALGPPEKARSGARGLHVFVNGRPVRDRALSRAVAFAYGSVLERGRYPVGVVHLSVAVGQVDVNVHPQKAEVRFADGRRVLDTLTRILAKELGTVAFGGPPGHVASGPAARGPTFWEERLGGLGPDARPRADAATPPADPWGLATALRDGTEDYGSDAARFQVAPGSPTDRPEERITERVDRVAALPMGEPGRFSSLRVLGQVRRMLLVCEGPDGLHVIDQHAADERVRYQRLRDAHARRSVATQRLLFPERVEMGPTDVSLFEERAETLRALGLECALVGPTTAAVHAVPSLVRRAPAERLLRDVLAELDHAGGRAFGESVDLALATMACHGAIRAGDSLSPDECAALLRSMDEVGEFAGHCPHGRPVVYSVPFRELERRLGR